MRLLRSDAERGAWVNCVSVPPVPGKGGSCGQDASTSMGTPSSAGDAGSALAAVVDAWLAQGGEVAMSAVQARRCNTGGVSSQPPAPPTKQAGSGGAARAGGPSGNPTGEAAGAGAGAGAGAAQGPGLGLARAREARGGVACSVGAPCDLLACGLDRSSAASGDLPTNFTMSSPAGCRAWPGSPAAFPWAKRYLATKLPPGSGAAGAPVVTTTAAPHGGPAAPSGALAGCCKGCRAPRATARRSGDAGARDAPGAGEAGGGAAGPGAGPAPGPAAGRRGVCNAAPAGASALRLCP